MIWQVIWKNACKNYLTSSANSWIKAQCSSNSMYEWPACASCSCYISSRSRQTEVLWPKCNKQRNLFLGKPQCASWVFSTTLSLYCGVGNHHQISVIIIQSMNYPSDLFHATSKNRKGRHVPSPVPFNFVLVPPSPKKSNASLCRSIIIYHVIN